MSRKILTLVTFFYISFWVYSQEQESLLKIIANSDLTELTQRRIDSFLKVNESKISPVTLADCYHDLGAKWYYPNWVKTGDISAIEDAIIFTHKAMNIKKDIPSLETCSLNKTLFNLGIFRAINGNIYEAIEVYIEIVRNGSNYCSDKERDRVQDAHAQLGMLYMNTGDFYQGIDAYENLISAYKDRPNLNNYEQKRFVDAYIRIAEIYALIDLEKFSKEIKNNLDEASIAIQKNGIGCCTYENRINQLEGNRLLELGNYEDAMKSHNAVILGLSENDSIDLAIAYNSLSISYLQLKDLELAYKSLQKAISYNPIYSDPFNNLGDYYLARGEFKRALEHYQKAINYSLDKNLDLDFDELPSIDKIELSPDKIYLLNHLVTKARAWLEFYDNDGNTKLLYNALNTFTLADKLVDLIRYESSEQQSKLYWREQSTSLYMKAVEVCYLLNKSEEAFYFMERNKALLLLEDLTNEEAKEIANLPQKLVQREFNLKRNIHLSENDLQEADNANKEIIAHLKDSIRENKYRYEQFVDSLNRSYPDYAKFKKKVDILSLDELKSDYISNSQLVLHYILNEDDGYGLLSSIEGSFLFQLIEVSQLNDEIDTLISLLADGNSDITTYNTTSNALFKKLIPQDIYTKIKGKHVTIIPDYTLQRLPFEALAVSINGPKYLLAEVEVSYDYSLSLLKQNSSIQRKSDGGLLAFAPVQFTSLGLTELPFSEREVKEIAEVVPGDIHVNGKATKKAFLEQMKDHKIIHLATHADLGDGENPWIAFADEKMFLKEIYATKNQAKMVVLSACNTLDGELKRGEGIMSLARGFFYSGAKSVVSSLWPVNDNVGKEILIKFYQNLDQGNTKSKALQNAKLKYLTTVSEKKLKHPYYWAGFVVLGNNEPLSDDQRSLWYFMGMGILIVALLFAALKLFKIVK